MSYGLKKTTYKAVRGLQGLVGHYSKGQKLVAEAVEPKITWGPETALMDRIAELTRTPSECSSILSMIWQNISSTTTKKWRRVYKNLLLLEHLLTYGSEDCVRQIRDNVYRVRALSNYVYKDKNGNDQGINVRKRSGIVADLATDEELGDIRRRAQENKSRYRGVSSESSGYGGYGGYGGYNSYDSYSSSGYGSSSRPSATQPKPAAKAHDSFVEQPPPPDLVIENDAWAAQAPQQPPQPQPQQQQPFAPPQPAPSASAGGWGAAPPQQQSAPVDLWGAPAFQQQPPQPQPQPQQQPLIDLFAVSGPAAQAPAPQRPVTLPPMTAAQSAPRNDPLADLFGPPAPARPQQQGTRPLDRSQPRSPLDSLFDM